MSQPATESLRSLLRYLAAFDDASLEQAVACFRYKTVKRNTLLLREGEVSHEFYFVHRGCLRTYFINRKGQEKTRFVLPDMSVGTALTSFISQTPSVEWVDALEDTELMVVRHTDFYQLVRDVPQWQLLYTKMLEMAYSFQNRKVASLLTLTAKQRYEQLLEQNPQLVQKLSNKVLASYLGMTQETLSRLKSH